MAWDVDFRLPIGAFFTPGQRRQIEALFRALHPRDPARGIPGADDCGAARYLDLLLQWPETGPIKIHADLASWKASYPQWLEKLDAAAKAEFGKGLDALSEVNVTELLRKLEAGELTSLGTAREQQTIFDTLWRHCLQGCWSDPRWGGNRNRIMWRWLGYLQKSETVDLAGKEAR